MKSYCISVTYDCNWNCPYCSQDTYNKCTTYEEVLEYVDMVPEWSDITLSGGEPGLLETEKLLEIVKILKGKGCYVDINTNGELFKHPEVIEDIDSIYYHCTMNMDIDDVVIRDYKDKTVYLVVVTDNNINNLEPFLEKNSDLEFVVHPAREVPLNGKTGESLSKKNVLKLAAKYKDSPEQFMILMEFNKTMCGAIRFDE